MGDHGKRFMVYFVKNNGSKIFSFNLTLNSSWKNWVWQIMIRFSGPYNTNASEKGCFDNLTIKGIPTLFFIIMC